MVCCAEVVVVIFHGSTILDQRVLHLVIAWAEFLDFLRQIDRETPKEQNLHLIMDNSSTHKTL